MSETSSWTKWIVLSLSDYIQTYIANLGNNDYVWFQDTFKLSDPPPDRFEVRYLGPDTHTQTKTDSLIHVTINCQVSTLRTLNNLEKHLIRIGAIKAMLVQCIPVYMFGSDSVNDTKAYWNTMQQNSDVMVTTLGTIDPVSKVERTTVEATYKIVVTE